MTRIILSEIETDPMFTLSVTSGCLVCTCLWFVMSGTLICMFCLWIVMSDVSQENRESYLPIFLSYFNLSWKGYIRQSKLFPLMHSHIGSRCALISILTSCSSYAFMRAIAYECVMSGDMHDCMSISRCADMDSTYMLNIYFFSFLENLTTKPWILQDLKKKPKYLLTFTVGYDQRHNIDAAVKKVTWIDYIYIFELLCVFTISYFLHKYWLLNCSVVFWWFCNFALSLWWSN